MSRYSLNPDRLFDRPWRPGHPFRPKTGRFRRLAMLVLLILLCSVIWTYGYITDSERVRAQAIGYLTGLIGGRVTVEHASLSLFEGLRLDGVKVYADLDEEEPGVAPKPDSLLFSARSFIVQYEPRALVHGRITAQQIIAEQPQVHLSHDVATNLWNFNRLGQTKKFRPAPAPSVPSNPMPLPELLLRNARVEISELRDGQNQRQGFISIDGQLAPQTSLDGTHTDRYAFVLQSRGVSDALGPLVTGEVRLDTGKIVANLKQFEFGPDVQSMLPQDVGRLLGRLETSGRIDVRHMEYAPARDGGPPAFRVEMVLDRVNFSVPPDQWMSGAESVRREDARGADSMFHQAFAAAGYGVPGNAPAPPQPQTQPASTDRAPRNPGDVLAAKLVTPSVQFRQVSGSFVFTESGFDVQNLTGRVEDNLLAIDGHVSGYGPDARILLHVGSTDAENIVIPAAPRYVWSLPSSVRELYEQTRPQGSCRMAFDVSRQVEGGSIEAGGYVELVDAQFLIKDFPYPVRQTQGRAEVRRDPSTGQDWLLLKGIRGHGVAAGPNADKYFYADGWIGPVNVPNVLPGGLIKIRGENVSSEPALHAAMPPDVIDALKIFDAQGTGRYPIFRSDVSCEVYKEIGPPGPFKVRVDLDIKEADGMLVGFPYPLHKLRGRVNIREGYADILDVTVPRGTSSANVKGRVVWPVPNFHPPGELSRRSTDLKLEVKDLDIDEDLLSALPKDAVDWIRRTNVQGKLDASGHVFGQSVEVMATQAEGQPLDMDFDLKLHHASLRPENGQFEISSVLGAMHLTTGRLDLLDVHGTRGDSHLSAMGQVVWAGSQPRTILTASAENLAMDQQLYGLLPAAAQAAWDEVRPKGTLDAEVTYSGEISGGGPASTSLAPTVTVVDLGRPAGAQATQPTAMMLELPPSNGRPAISREIASGLRGVLRARDLSANLLSVPYPLEKLSGEVALSPDRVDLKQIVARHGKAELLVSGVGTISPDPQWDLRITAKALPVDEALRKALPATLGGLLESLKMTGSIGVDFDKFVYRSVKESAKPATVGPAVPPPVGPSLDLAGKLTLNDVGLDAGVPLEKANGSVQLAASVRDGQLRGLDGSLDIASFEMAGREVTDFKADLVKVADQPQLMLKKMQAVVAGGDFAGEVAVAYPETGPAHYGLNLFLRNADVKELAMESAEKLSGRMTASLALEGTWGKAGARRGRGDVVVTGQEMYRIPLLLGLMQVTNLALPINSPFSNATARYSVDGQKVAFEQIELRSNNMLMTGDGQLDFENKQVRMQFVTDNPGGFRIPFLQDLWRGAQHELLRITVHGTIQDPKVENRPLGTFTTTVDQVFKGDSPKSRPKK